MLREVSPYIAGVKIGVPTIIRLGFNIMKNMIINVKDASLYLIADMKIADVEHISGSIVSLISEIGFDALIAHAFIGYEGGLNSIAKLTRDHGLGLYSVCAMSHRGGEDFINKNMRSLLELSLKVGVDGVILPATMPKYIRYARRLAKDILILAPGVGAQGAKVGSAIAEGADFEIIGRLIYLSKNPKDKAFEIRRVLKW